MIIAPFRQNGPVQAIDISLAIAREPVNRYCLNLNGALLDFLRHDGVSETCDLRFVSIIVILISFRHDGVTDTCDLRYRFLNRHPKLFVWQREPE